MRMYAPSLVMGLAGLVIVLYGLYLAVRPDAPTVEIIQQPMASDSLNLVVDVGGAVEKPGVYRLAPHSRVGDALVSAQGLSARADRAWVSRNLNLAREVADGEKVYIPEFGSGGISGESAAVVEESASEIVNINTASQVQLERLNGIGTARAQAIISNRPYGTSEELVDKAKIPPSVYENIKDVLTVY